MGGNIWGAYVREVTDGGRNQQQIAARAGVNQGTVSRWLGPARLVPDKGGVVAAFCRGYDRNPVEGFVAAGMLTEDEAGRALTKREREFLAELREDVADAERHARRAEATAGRRAASQSPPEKRSQRPRKRGTA